MQAKTDVFRVSVATILLMSLGGCASNMPLTESRAVEIVMRSGFPTIARCAMQIERERAPVLFQEIQRLIDTGTFTETEEYGDYGYLQRTQIGRAHV